MNLRNEKKPTLVSLFPSDHALAGQMDAYDSFDLIVELVAVPVALWKNVKS